MLKKEEHCLQLVSDSKMSGFSPSKGTTPKFPNKALIFLAVFVLLYLPLVNAQNIIGGEITANKIRQTTKAIDITFDYYQNHAENGWYVFEGEIKNLQDNAEYQILIDNKNFNAEIGQQKTVEKLVSEKQCSSKEFFYENGTPDVDENCKDVLILKNVTYYDYKKLPYTTEISKDQNSKYAVRIERITVQKEEKFSIVVIPLNQNLEQSKSLESGAGVDPIVDPTINEISRWTCTGAGGDIDDLEDNNELNNTRVTCEASTINGEPVNAIRFDASQKASLVNITPQYLTGQNGGTFVAWINDSGGHVGNFDIGTIATSHDTDTDRGWVVWCDDESYNPEKIQLKLPANALGMDIGQMYDLWHFYALVMNESTGREIWFDGKLNQSSSTHELPVAYTRFAMGYEYAGTNGYYFNGEVYCPRFFNASLTPAQIVALYNTGIPTCTDLSTLTMDTPPTISNVTTNNTGQIYYNEDINLYVRVIDVEALDTVILETDISGSLENWTIYHGTGTLMTATVQLNLTTQEVVHYTWYANDSTGQWSQVSSILNITGMAVTGLNCYASTEQEMAFISDKNRFLCILNNTQGINKTRCIVKVYASGTLIQTQPQKSDIEGVGTIEYFEPKQETNQTEIVQMYITNENLVPDQEFVANVSCIKEGNVYSTEVRFTPRFYDIIHRVGAIILYMRYNTWAYVFMFMGAMLLLGAGIWAIKEARKKYYRG